MNTRRSLNDNSSTTEAVYLLIIQADSHEWQEHKHMEWNTLGFFTELLVDMNF
jgi:hypothetical protein